MVVDRATRLGDCYGRKRLPGSEAEWVADWRGWVGAMDANGCEAECHPGQEYGDLLKRGSNGILLSELVSAFYLGKLSQFLYFTSVKWASSCILYLLI